MLSKQTMAPQQSRGAWSELFSPRWRKNTIVGCVFYTCQVIPYFALGTFSPKVLEALQVKDKFVGGLVYNILLFAGAVIGLLLIDKLSRRMFLIGTFYFAALALAVLAYASFGPIGTMLALGLFACILSAAANLEFVYPPELFPTHLRASGVGLAVASSRFGSAISTFLLPSANSQTVPAARLTISPVTQGRFDDFLPLRARVEPRRAAAHRRSRDSRRYRRRSPPAMR